MSDESISLNKYISSTGICSRREADAMIKAGRVKLNKKVAVTGNRVMPGDQVLIDGKPLKTKQQKEVYIALNKPVGIICTTERKIKNNIVDFVKHQRRIFPIGRLDKPSEGLIFLTSDGDIVNKILRAGNQHEKEYIVSVDKAITNRFIERMSAGVPILGTVTQKCIVEQIGKHSFKIILTQGLNRQIRRMCTYLGYSVTKLKRVRIMNIKLDGLGVGQWRELSKEEMLEINKKIAGSSKTEEASKLKAPAVQPSKRKRIKRPAGKTKFQGQQRKSAKD